GPIEEPRLHGPGGRHVPAPEVSRLEPAERQRSLRRRGSGRGERHFLESRSHGGRVAIEDGPLQLSRQELGERRALRRKEGEESVLLSQRVSFGRQTFMRGRSYAKGRPA